MVMGSNVIPVFHSSIPFHHSIPLILDSPTHIHSAWLFITFLVDLSQVWFLMEIRSQTSHFTQRFPAQQKPSRRSALVVVQKQLLRLLIYL